MKRILLALAFTLFTSIPVALAQDTPSAVAPTAEVVTATPSPEATIEPTATPAPVDVTPATPYILNAVVAIIIAVLTVFGFIAVLLFRSQPIVWAIARPLGDAGVDAYGNYVKTTPSPSDDAAADELRKEWEAFKLLMINKAAAVDAKVDAQSVKIESVSQKVNP